MKRKLSTFVLVIVFLIGLSLLLYPSVASYVNSLHQSTAVTRYTNDLSNMNQEKYEEVLASADAYNQRMVENGVAYHLNEAQAADYERQLDVSSSKVMGYVSIPSIRCELPIYHGTDKGTLAVGIGHLEWTSLPVGGEGTHCVLSGHRGLPSARLFTDLDLVHIGDIFQITVMNRELTYEVDQILIVLPEETDALLPIAGEDYCTLVTCTPYGVNSHRLLVRGHRIANPKQASKTVLSSDAVQIKPIIIAPFFAIPLLLVLFSVVLVKDRKKN